MKDIHAAVESEREYFASRRTFEIDFRIKSLKRLKEAVISNEENIAAALSADLGKSGYETYMTETGQFLQEIGLHIKKLSKWARPAGAKTPIHSFPARSFVYPEPYGVVLIIAPWNFPFLLSMVPLVGAISAGNCVVLKPAHYSENTSEVIRKVIEESFAVEYVSVFTGGREVNEALLNERYDYIFFTGSAPLGRLVMEKASRNLTPVTLELGGQSPAIVDGDADIEVAAKRIAWGKYLNAGQTCVCPDYVLVHERVKKDFVDCLVRQIELLFGDDPSANPDYGRIINRAHWHKLSTLFEGRNGGAIIRGKPDEGSRYIPPVILPDASDDDPAMHEEIFGPVLPVLTFKTLDEALERIRSRPKPLTLYYFGNNPRSQEKVLSGASFGSGCINDIMLQFSNPYLPFGGIGASGMGSYHGKKTFDTFTHYKSILKNSTKIDLPFRYPPYAKKLPLLKMVLK